MNLIELNRALRQLRLGGIAAVLETRLQQAQAEPMAPIDFLSCLVSDELRRGDRLLERRGQILKCGPRSWRTKPTCPIRRSRINKDYVLGYTVGRFSTDPRGRRTVFLLSLTWR